MWMHTLNNTGRERLLLILPVLLVSALLFAFDAPLGVAVPLTALSVLLPALVCLHALRQAVRSAAVPAHTESFIQRLIDVIPDPVFIKRAGGQYLMINQAFADYRGYAGRESVPRTRTELHPALSRPIARYVELVTSMTRRSSRSESSVS